MRRKPTSQGDYRPADLARAISACLQVAEGLGEELMAQKTSRKATLASRLPASM